MVQKLKYWNANVTKNILCFFKQTLQFTLTHSYEFQISKYEKFPGEAYRGPQITKYVLMNGLKVLPRIVCSAWSIRTMIYSVIRDLNLSQSSVPNLSMQILVPPQESDKQVTFTSTLMFPSWCKKIDPAFNFLFNLESRPPEKNLPYFLPEHLL